MIMPLTGSGWVLSPPPIPPAAQEAFGEHLFFDGGYGGARARAPVGRPCNKGEGIAIQSIQYEGEGDAIHILKDASHRNNRE